MISGYLESLWIHPGMSLLPEMHGPLHLNDIEDAWHNGIGGILCSLLLLWGGEHSVTAIHI